MIKVGCRFLYGRTGVISEAGLFALFAAHRREVDRLWTVSADKEKANAAFSRAKAERAGEVFDAYGNSILRLAYAYLHSMDDAEDILQDTLIRYMQKAPEFEDANHEKAWLLHVAANLAKNRLDYNKVRQADDMDELAETLAEEKKEDLSFLWEAVKALPVKQREVIHLFYEEGYQTAEIAQILGERESTVRSHLRRGRIRLKEILKDEYDYV